MPTSKNIDPPPKSPVRFSGGTLALAADRVQHAVERDVVDVVSGLQAPRAGLTPTRHPRVDQALVDLRAVLGAESQPLGHARPQALDEHVGLGDQLQHEVTALVGLEVGGHGPTIAQRGFALAGRNAAELAGALDPHHVGAEVAEDHRGVWTRPDAG
jgi:hypothetical protein